MTSNRQFILKRRPNGTPAAEDFALETSALPALEEGQFLIRNHYASLDPAQRGWMSDADSYMPPIPLGAPVRATTIGVVEDSRAEGFAKGQWVMGLNAIEDYSVGTLGGFTQPIDPHAVPKVTNYLSLFGAVGMTAYFGFLDVCEPKPGDVVLVTGAAGAVGSLVGQIAKILGCTAIGIAGGAEKCARLTERYGFDHAIDYRGKDVRALDVQVIEQLGGVSGHVRERVGHCWDGLLEECCLDDLVHVDAHAVQLGGEPAVAIVEADDEVALVDEQLAELWFPRHHLGGVAHDEEQCRVARVTEGVVFEGDRAVVGRGELGLGHGFSLTDCSPPRQLGARNLNQQ